MTVWKPWPLAYCPRHEWDLRECCQCCLPLRTELRRIDNDLRVHWYRLGMTFTRRGRAGKVKEEVA